MDGAEVVITTMGLTTASTKFTSYDIDYRGNLNLYNEAKAAGVKKFNYISVIACDLPGAEKVPMLHAKFMLENEIKKGDMDYVIYRPTGYFYDIAKVFKPYVDKGEMQLLTLMLAVILLTGYLVIYNVFRISVAGDVRF